ncbi:hypothetical protein COEREDRAFT_41255 [Coemansia reversa NRRL 1564]|uniref:Transposase n=1 Tax=Coemansia reversa (strain ATCC 12441 / NRRL 1564) TaxID=763665 RepID=A0A2G5BE77_COERN|nr:hypothetical protein COEREDRAFT_41255 [Coemansia reversa NRRL 1564]|eukprot:PIA17319.1 hypothetical protein COEREDRAFT_41255 [Coemansia reversa NRRL 1564]
MSVSHLAPATNFYIDKQRNKKRRLGHFADIREKVKKNYPGNWIHAAEELLQNMCCSTVNPEKYKAYIKARSEVWELLDNFYNETVTTYAKSHPLHQKLHLSAYWNKVRANDRFAKGLHKKFGRDAVLIIGNWPAGMVRFHEPIRGKGWRDVLRRHGFTVYLLDEYKTSSLCPACGSGLEKFHKIPNPRPWQRVNKKDVLCNGLLRCKNKKLSEVCCEIQGFDSCAYVES